MQIDFVTFIPSFMFVKKLHVMNMKTMKAKRLSRYMKVKNNYCKIGLNLILNTNNENKKQKNEVCKEKFKQIFILITYGNMNMKWNKQGYDSRLYFKLKLNKRKGMGNPTFINYNPFGDLIQGSFYVGFHMLITQGSFLKTFL